MSEQAISGGHGSVWDQVVGQDRAVAQLLDAAARGPVHAYLFVGPSGSTKLPAARAFAARLISGGDDVEQRDARLILRAARCDPPDVVGEELLQEDEGARTARLHLAHVGDVEDAGALADRGVLGADARVLHRHLPARERHEARPCCHVALVQGRPLQRLGVGHLGADPSAEPGGARSPRAPPACTPSGV